MSAVGVWSVNKVVAATPEHTWFSNNEKGVSLILNKFNYLGWVGLLVSGANNAYTCMLLSPSAFCQWC